MNLKYLSRVKVKFFNSWSGKVCGFGEFIIVKETPKQFLLWCEKAEGIDKSYVGRIIKVLKDTLTDSKDSKTNAGFEIVEHLGEVNELPRMFDNNLLYDVKVDDIIYLVERDRDVKVKKINLVDGYIEIKPVNIEKNAFIESLYSEKYYTVKDHKNTLRCGYQYSLISKTSLEYNNIQQKIQREIVRQEIVSKLTQIRDNDKLNRINDFVKSLMGVNKGE